MNSQKESEDLAIGIDLKYEKELKNLKRLLETKESKIEQLEKNLESTMKELREERWKIQDIQRKNQIQIEELSQTTGSLRTDLNCRVEEGKSKNKGVIIAIIIVFLILSGSISGVKSDIHRVKNKIIYLHGY